MKLLLFSISVTSYLVAAANTNAIDISSAREQRLEPKFLTRYRSYEPISSLYRRGQCYGKHCADPAAAEHSYHLLEGQQHGSTAAQDSFSNARDAPKRKGVGQGLKDKGIELMERGKNMREQAISMRKRRNEAKMEMQPAKPLPPHLRNPRNLSRETIVKRPEATGGSFGRAAAPRQENQVEGDASSARGYHSDSEVETKRRSPLKKITHSIKKSAAIAMGPPKY